MLFCQPCQSDHVKSKSPHAWVKTTLWMERISSLLDTVALVLIRPAQLDELEFRAKRKPLDLHGRERAIGLTRRHQLAQAAPRRARCCSRTLCGC